MRWRLALVVSSLVAGFAPLPGPAIEHVYSNGLYPAIQLVLTAFSNLVPFALFDLLIAAVVLGWFVLAIRDVTRRAGRRRVAVAAAVASRSLVWGAALYLAFLAAWGLNYRRVRLEERLPFDASASPTDGVRALASQ